MGVREAEGVSHDHNERHNKRWKTEDLDSHCALSTRSTVEPLSPLSMLRATSPPKFLTYYGNGSLYVQGVIPSRHPYAHGRHLRRLSLVRLSLNADERSKKVKKESMLYQGEGSFFLIFSLMVLLPTRFSGGGGAFGSGLRAAAAESGRGLRGGLTTMPPVGAAGVGAGAGDAESVKAEGLGATIEGEGEGEGLGAGELRVEDDDFAAGLAGWGWERRITCTFSIGTLNLRIFDFFRGGWLSELVALWLLSGASGRLSVCLGGPMDVFALLDTLMEEKTGLSTGSTFTAGCVGGGGGGCGKACGCLDFRGFIIFVRTFSVSLKTSLP